jgi:hypothetical protein
MYTILSILSLGSFDLPPPARIRLEMLPLHYNDLFDMCPFIFRLFHRTYPSQPSLCPSSYISSGCFDQPSFGL